MPSLSYRAIFRAEALEVIRQSPPGLAITDVVMPGMDGFELCARIRKEERFSGLPITIVTQLSDPEDIVKALAAGADSFMSKPYEEEVLLSRIQYILANRALRAGGRTEVTLEVELFGQRHRIATDRMQMLDLLIASYESAVRKSRRLEEANQELLAAQQRLEKINQQLQAEIEQRKESEAALRATQKQLKRKIEDQRQIMKAMVDRELRMAELKEVIRRLRAQLKAAGLTPVANDPLAEDED